jgi:hypothetical protein
MQLGIETVVILIIAIVLLGSMIYFIKSLIQPDSIKSIFVEQLGCGKTTIPTDNNPILPDRLKISLGEYDDVGFCVKNNIGTSIAGAEVRFLECIGPQGGASVPASTIFEVSSLKEDFGRGDPVKALPFSLTTKKGALEGEVLGTWICRVEVSPSGTPGIGPVQIRIEVE